MSRNEGKKRKRESEDDGAQPAKQLHLEENAAKTSANGSNGDSKGARRQAKSERRSKKAAEKKEKSKSRPRMNVAFSSNGAETVDSIATGQDFVSLDDGAAMNKKKNEVGGPKYNSQGKKSSPKSLRKQLQAAEKRALILKDGANSGGKAAAADTDDQTEQVNATHDNHNDNDKTSTSHRFIVFVGNLPYSATTEQIQAHFQKLMPKSIRHSTDKKTGKSKGFAFLEFESYDRMKTCLQNYHQSIFDPELTARDGGEVKQADDDDDDDDEGDGRTGRDRNLKPKGRRLNVELTAGGGGNTKGRKAKIKEKNGKLKEERDRRKLDKKKARQDKLRKKREMQEKNKRGGRGKSGPTGANAEVAVTTKPMEENGGDSRGDIHPSRLSRVQR